MPQPRVQVAQAFVSGADGGKPFGVVFRRVLPHQLQVARADRLVVRVARQPQHFVWVAHVLALKLVVEVGKGEAQWSREPIEHGECLPALADVVEHLFQLLGRRQGSRQFLGLFEQ